MNALWQAPAEGLPALRRRAMTVGDVDAVMAVEQQVYAFPWSRGNFIDSIAAGYLAELLLAGDGELIGYYVAMTGVDELHLLNITVASAHQGRGLGRRLLERIRAQGLALALSTLWLEVRDSNHRARALYRACGFAEVGRRRFYYPAAGRREDAVVMKLALQDPTVTGCRGSDVV